MTSTGKRKPTPLDQVLEPDGQIARTSQAYALEKLFYGDRYMDMFATATSKAFEFRTYVDLMAGPGRIDIDGKQYPGSPLLSEQAAFTNYVFIEADAALAGALCTRVDPSRVIQGDCNSTGIINRVRDKIEGPGMISLIFADNLGTDVPFETYRRLTDNRDADLMIVHQVGDITRNVRSAFKGTHSTARFTAYFGEGWKDVVAPILGRTSEEISDALLEFYLAQLGTLGYHYSSATATMRNSQHAKVYRVLLASRHPLGVELFKKAAEINPYGQRSLGLLD